MNAKEIIKFDFSSPPPPNILIQDTPLQAQKILSSPSLFPIVKLRRGSGKDRQGMASKVKGLKA